MSDKKPKSTLDIIKEQDAKKQTKVAVKLADKLRELMSTVHEYNAYLEYLLDAAGLKGEERKKILVYLESQTELTRKKERELQENAEDFVEGIEKNSEVETFE
jgi:hypothetical protein